MSFATPVYFGLLLLAFVLAGLIFWLERWRHRARRAFAGARSRSLGGGGRAVSLLVVIAASLIVIAAARPFWGSREFSRNRQGVDVVIVLDVSLSMTAQDVKPSRLGLAENEVARLIENMRGNRIGLVFFAGSAILRSPLSTDNAALAQIVRGADRTAALTRAGSDLGAALDQAGRILDASQTPGRAVILVSDGEDFGGTALDKARELRAKGIAVFATGVGTAAGSTLLDPSPRLRGQPQLKLDPQTGQPVITRLNEPNLEAMAQTGGGAYVRLSGSGRDLLGLRDNLGQLQQSPLGVETQKVPIERFQWFAGAALGLLALAWLVPAGIPSPMRGLGRRSRRHFEPPPQSSMNRAPAPNRAHAPYALALLVVAIVIGSACGSANSIRNRNGAANDLYTAGRFEGALEGYEALLAARPDLPELAYNAGNALARLGKYDRAVAETQRALPPAAGLGVATYYSLGNHYLALGQLREAFDAYRSALLLDPTDADSKYNLEIALSRLNAQRPPSNQGQGQPDQTAPDQSPRSDQPGGQPNPTGEPQPNPDQASTPGPANDPQRDLQQALAGLQDNLTFEDAVRILGLLDQLNAAQKGQRNQPAGTGGPDY